MFDLVCALEKQFLEIGLQMDDLSSFLCKIWNKQNPSGSPISDDIYSEVSSGKYIGIYRCEMTSLSLTLR